MGHSPKLITVSKSRFESICKINHEAFHQNKNAYKRTLKRHNAVGIQSEKRSKDKGTTLVPTRRESPRPESDVKWTPAKATAEITAN